MSAKFSNVLNLTDLNDFITPAQSCIRPPTTAPTATTSARDTVLSSSRVELGYDDMKVEVARQTTQEKAEPVTISLSDCLACSGCITSAESVLVNQQTTNEFLNYLASPTRSSSLVVVSVSPQSRASFAAKYGLDTLSTARRMTWFLKSVLNVDLVFDISAAKDLCLIAAADEFIERKKKQSVPVIASICPGWICYAEKTHPNLLHYVSNVKSPQQIMGSMVKKLDLSNLMNGESGQQHGTKPWLSLHDRAVIYHVTIMPCYDKKLEASRSDFYDELSASQEIDCVLTTGELEKIILQYGYSFDSLSQVSCPYDFPFSNTVVSAAMGDVQLLRTEGSGTGGYLEYILRRASLELFQKQVTLSDMKVTTLRHKDYKEYRLQDEHGQTLLTFVAAYGFRHIQNIVKKLKDRKESDPTIDFIELMACPSGCLNGGGQLEPSMEPELLQQYESGQGLSSSLHRKALLQRTESVYASMLTREPHEHSDIVEILQRCLDGSTTSAKGQRILRTTYHAVPTTLPTRIQVKW